jgi:uncharacterized protein
MTPYFFGPAGKQLYGVYSPPEQHSASSRAVLLCYPGGLEYYRCHRAFTSLAAKLSHQGWHVLRFDYSGTGDSAGSADAVKVSEWLEDIKLALKELREVSGVKSASLVGLRLGASLAVALQGVRLDKLVLWDPVITGRSYLESLRRMQEKKLSCSYYPRKTMPRESCEEILGFQYPEQMISFLEELELGKQGKPAARSISVICSQDNPEYAELERLAQMWKCEFKTHRSPEVAAWEDYDSAHKALMVPQSLQFITNTLG